jgi:predicted RNase H-like HicB family nuclease
LPTASPDATATFATGGEAGKRKLRLMILRYINAAMERAHYEIIEDAEPFYGSIPGIQGVWATGVTLEACRKELADSLEDWLLLSVRQGADIPPVGDVKLEIPHEVA